MNKNGQIASQRELFTELRIKKRYGSYVLGISPGGFCRFNEQLSNGLHQHNFFEICLVLSGRGVFRHGDEHFDLRSGDLFVADPGVYHEISSYETRDLYLVFWSFSIESLAGQEVKDWSDPIVANFLADHKLLAREAEYLEEFLPLLEMGHRSHFMQTREEVTAHLILEMMANLTGVEGSVRQENTRPLPLNIALQVIDQNLTKKLSVGEIAKAAHVSERSLRRMFRSHLGKSVTEVVRERMISQCAYLLRMRFNVAEVGRRVGIESQAQFSRFFKKQFGMSPKAYQSQSSPSLSYGKTSWSGQKRSVIKSYDG